MLKTNIIKCATCNIEYDIKDIELFKPNKLVEDILSAGVHLSDEEKSLKLQAMGDFYELCNELGETTSVLEVEVYNHFVELRRKIDIRCEEAKARIDDLYMEMIDLSKKAEAKYMEQLKMALVRNADKLLENGRKVLAEKSRDPNLLIQTVRDMQARQEEFITALKTKIGELTEIRKLLSEKEFKSGVVFDKELFVELWFIKIGRMRIFSF